MDPQQLQQIIEAHELWLSSDKKQGKRAELQKTELQSGSLKIANLQVAESRKAEARKAKLWRANLQTINLQEADLEGANLQKAQLWGANLRKAYLRKADLRGADLRETDLQDTDLREADLREADLREAYLLGANLQAAKLEGAKYSLEQLQQASNVPLKYLPDVNQTSKDFYQHRADEAQSKVTALELEKRELEAKLEAAEQDGEQSASLKQSLEAAEVELDQVRSQLEQNKQKQAIVDELAGAIEPILEAVKSDKDTVEAYKRQSQRLLISGLLCFGLAVAFIFGKAALAWQLPPSTPTISVAQLLLQIAPGFVFAILGSALLRHDWKIRQLTLKLIDQNNSVDIAMGMLKTALRLSNIGEREKIEEIPDLVKESFAEARRALLYRNRGDASALDDTSSKDADLLQQIRGLVLKSSSSD